MKKIFSLVAAVLFAGSMMAEPVLSIDFTQGQGEWTINDVILPDSSDFVWAQDSKYGMKATAFFNSKNHASESWLISPVISLEGLTSATLSFSHARRYGNLEQLSVVAKSANDASWSPLEVSAWPDGTSWTFVDAQADLTAYAGDPAIQIAFVYTSSDEAASTWEIKTVSVAAGGDVPPVVNPDVVFTGADFLGQGTASSGSPVSATKDGVTFACDKAYSDDDHATLRCYKNGVITITSETEQIGKLVFQFYSTYTGDLDNEVVVNAKEWSYTLTNQARIEKLEIYFGEYTPVDPPVVVLDTVTVAEAVEIGMALADNAKTEKDYVVAGFVVKAYEPSEGYTDQTWFMADEAGAFGEFEAYRCTPDSHVAEGDYMYVKGKIQKYVKDEKVQIEIGNGTATHGEAPQGIENVQLTNEAQKVMVDGVMYIVRDGKMFNVQGAQVR